MRRTSALFLIIFLMGVSGCGSYKHPDFLIKHVNFYDNRAQYGKLTVAADPYVVKGKQEMLFNYDAIKRGIYPIHVIFFNEGDETYDLSKASITLVSETGERYPVLSGKEAEDMVSRSVLLRSVKFGIVGACIGTIFAPITVIPATLWGGVDTHKSNRLSHDMISEKAFREAKISANSVISGFVFFNLAQDTKDKEALLEFEKSYQLEILDVRSAAGEPVNFSIYLPPSDIIKTNR